MGHATGTTWRRLSLLPSCLLVAAMIGLVVSGWAIDASSLDQGEDSWGFAAGALIVSVVAAPVLFVALALAALPRLLGSPAVQSASAWAGAVVCGASGVGLALLTVPSMGGTPADTVFGAVALVLDAVLLVPLGACGVHARRQRASAASAAVS